MRFKAGWDSTKRMLIFSSKKVLHRLSLVDHVSQGSVQYGVEAGASAFSA